MKEAIPMFETIDEILTVNDVAEILYVGRNTIYDLLNSGQLKGFRIGSKSWRIPRQCLNEYILEKSGSTTSP